LRTFAGPREFVQGIVFSPDGKALACANGNNTVSLRKVDTGEEFATLEGHSRYVRPVAFSGDGKVLASVGGDKTVKLWDVEKKEEMRTLSGHSNLWTSAQGKAMAARVPTKGDPVPVPSTKAK
jgi:WD40 repeat protein